MDKEIRELERELSATGDENVSKRLLAKKAASGLINPFKTYWKIRQVGTGLYVTGFGKVLKDKGRAFKSRDEALNYVVEKFSSDYWIDRLGKLEIVGLHEFVQEFSCESDFDLAKERKLIELREIQTNKEQLLKAEKKLLKEING